jgi:hypothetical protein
MQFVVNLSLEEWMNRKAEQNAHSEILAFLMMILGMNLLVGGLVVTIITVGEPIWFSFLVQPPMSRSAFLGLTLTFVGFAVIIVGFIMVIHYDRQRSWFLREIERSSLIKNRRITVQNAHDVLEELVYGKEKE